MAAAQSSNNTCMFETTSKKTNNVHQTVHAFKWLFSFLFFRMGSDLAACLTAPVAACCSPFIVSDATTFPDD